VSIFSLLNQDNLLNGSY